MQEKREKKISDNNLGFVRMTALSAALLFILAACPSPTGVEQNGEKVDPIVGGVPQMPNISRTQAGYEIDSLLAVVDNPGYSEDPSHISGVVSAVWNPAAGATGYNVYAKKATRFTNPIPNPRDGSNGVYDTAAGDAVPAGSTALTPEPGDPVAVNVPDTFYFHRNCEEDGIYYFWVEGINRKGAGTKSAPVSQYLGKKGRQENGGIERGDYPRDLTTVSGDGKIELSWSLSDRVGWYEVYYSPTNIDFDKLEESWDESDGPLVPYQQSAVTVGGTAAIPWKGTGAGVPGTPEKLFTLKTTITGLTNGTEYFFWVRSPNANGERGYSKIMAAPESSAGPAFPAVQNIRVSANNPGELTVTWDKVDGAAEYRVYFSMYDITPEASAVHDRVSGSMTTFTKKGFDKNTQYYVWVVARKGNIAGDFGSPAIGVTRNEDVQYSANVKKYDLNGNLIENVLYIEVNDNDPRIALGYVLEASNAQFFDYVILFAANLRNRDCLNENPKNHFCTKQGVHLHFNGNVQHILDNRDKYIKPLQDRGIKVLLGLLGDWGGVGFGTFGEWPMEDVYPWAENNNGNPYPYTAEVRRTFLTQVRDAVIQYGLDGIDLDDEWASANAGQKGLAVYPSQAGYYSNAGSRMFAWARCGVNFANLLVEARELLGPEKIITVFEWQSARWMPSTVTENGAEKPVHEYYNFITEAAYGSWNAFGYYVGAVAPESLCNRPLRKYAPVGIDICGGDSPGEPRPSISGFNSLGDRARQEAEWNESHPANYYGVNMFYALQSQATASKPFAGYSHPKLWDLTRNRTLTQEEYLSLLSYPLYGENVIYIGKDYPQDWARY
ncbi:MAG: fibronectin type III domain-containing protein [Treponema sp.]|nr:fibronectin type III domain-containing protein [Treponema sp.]